MEQKTCAVTGHRTLPHEQIEQIKSWLQTQIERAISDGFVHFISGFAQGTDLYFAQIVARYKQNYPISLEAAIPYSGRMQTRDFMFHQCLACCDRVTIHSDYYFRGCYMRRNYDLVDQAQRIIAVYDGGIQSGTAATVAYARRRGREVVCLPVHRGKSGIF